jgi:nitrate ABC transporter ATP-binding subunit
MVVFQNYSLLPWQTVRQNVALAVNSVMASSPVAERKQTIDRSIKMVGLSHAADKVPAELSGGMKQRVAIARALSIRPRLLLLDEPFGALDALTRGNLQQQLMQICQEAGVTTVMVTHDVDEALLLSDRVVMMTNGPEAEIGQILNVPFARPRQRLEVIEHPDYYHLRGELIGFLHQQRRLRQHRSSVAAAASVVAASGVVAAAGIDGRQAGANALPPARKQGPRRPETIRLGFLPGLDIAPLAVALDKSLFDGATIEVVPVPFARWDRLEAKLLEKKNAPYKLTVEDTQNDDNTIVEMTEKRMEELKLMRGDQVLIKGKNYSTKMNIFIGKKKHKTVCIAFTAEEGSGAVDG